MVDADALEQEFDKDVVTIWEDLHDLVHAEQDVTEQIENNKNRLANEGIDVTLYMAVIKTMNELTQLSEAIGDSLGDAHRSLKAGNDAEAKNEVADAEESATRMEELIEEHMDVLSLASPKFAIALNEVLTELEKLKPELKSFAEKEGV